MPIQSSGQIIKLSDIKNEFNNGGTGVIKLSDYYSNSVKGYTSGVTGIPTINSKISLSQFYGKSKIVDQASLPTIIGNGSTVTFTTLPGNIYYYVFTTGTNSITFSSSITCEVLIVGGGGGGGGGFLGAGGAGGNVYYNNAYTFNTGTYNINIGSGGSGGNGYAYSGGSISGNGNSGGTSNIVLNGTQILYAGGGGSGSSHNVYNWNFAIGGSTSSTIVTNSNSVTTNYSGGPGSCNFSGGFDGGGGAGASQNGGVTNMSNGGNGYQSSITGTSNYYGAGAGGRGNIDTVNIDGLGFNNYGSGGRAGYWDTDSGGSGISGCVIIKFIYNLYSLPTTNLYAQYSGDGPFTSTQWNDISGNLRHIVTFRGTPTKIPFTQGTKGLTGTSSINIINGTYNDGVTLPFALTSASYTIAYMARYIGTTDTTFNRRIFDSNNYNYLWGFWNKTNGCSYNTVSWVANANRKISDSDYWIIGIETEISARYNGYNWTNGTPTRPGLNPIPTINNGIYSGNNSESSNWQVAELIIYNTELTLANQILVEQYLANKYKHFSFSNVVPSNIAFNALTNNTGIYDNWFNIWNSQYYTFINSTWYLSSSLTPFVISGNAVANMNTTNTNGLFGSVDDGNAVLPGYKFNFLGNSYNGNIFLGTNNYLTFGGGSSIYSGFSVSNPPIPGIFFGAFDRHTNWCNYNNFYTNLNGTEIGRIILNTSDYSNRGANLQVEILLIRNTSTTYQYVQFNCNFSNVGGGTWYLKNSSSGVSVTNFSIGSFTSGQSFVFRSDASGNNWEFLNQSRVIYSIM
jgi:hypothetical protein